jgi:hypothetical protein
MIPSLVGRLLMQWLVVRRKWLVHPVSATDLFVEQIQGTVAVL